MARRRELKSIASGIAHSCVSRNNDIGGYWAIGVIYKLALSQGLDQINVDLYSSEPIAPELSLFRKQFLSQIKEQRNHLLDYVQGMTVSFKFEEYSTNSRRGTKARVICTVSIIDDLNIARSASATTYCYPHDPSFEHQSTRSS